MSAPTKWKAALALVAGALMLGSCIPLSEILLTTAFEEGGTLASLVVLTMLGGTGLFLVVWGWRMARQSQERL